MSNPIDINASRARSDFFTILEEVYMKNRSYIIKKSGIPVAKLVKPSEGGKSDIMKFAGAWKGMGSEKIVGYVYEGRKDKGELKRELPKII